MADYWQDRQSLLYYDEVRRLLEALPGESLLDVGANDVPVSTWGKFGKRTAVDLCCLPMFPQVEGMQADFHTWSAASLFHTVTCMQVLEHLDDPRAFALRLFACASQRVIITVPYMWPKGFCSSHRQDPVSFQDLLSWCHPYDPTYTDVVTEDNGVSRLIAVFDINEQTCAALD